MSPSFVENSFQGTSHSPHIRDDFSSNCVFEQEKTNLKNVREFFVHHWPKKKNLFQFLHSIMVWEKCWKHHLPQEGGCTSRVTLVKSIFLLDGMTKLLTWKRGKLGKFDVKLAFWDDLGLCWTKRSTTYRSTVPAWKRSACVFLHSENWLEAQRRLQSAAPPLRSATPFSGTFWRPSWCPNWEMDS